MFFAGAAQGVVTMLWWLADLLGRYAGWYGPVVWTVPAPWVHAFLMLYGFLPFFMFGFLMTAVPNWLKVPVPRAYYLSSMFLMSAGCLLFYPGLVTDRAVVAVGLVLMLVGWAVGLAGLVRLVVLTPERDVRHPLLLCGAMGFGWIGLACLLVALYGDSALAAAVFRIGGVWFFALPIFVSISNRMVPFFSSRVLDNYTIARPAWSQPLLIGGSFAHGLLAIAGLPEWTWVIDAPMAVAVFYLAWKWGLARSFKVHLLAVLHISLVVLAASLSLFAAQSLVLFVSGSHVLGLAPLHAMTIGYFAAMVIGMVSRVSLGHSGRMLMADRLTWYCFLGVVATALLRVAAELPGVTPIVGYWMTWLSAAAWLGCFVPWTWRYLPMYVAVRVDRQPG
jgi:uncharacterized protein involved in response to NO